MPYRAISSYFSPGAAATRRPPAGWPARPAAGTLPPPARGLGPRRIRPAWGGGPGPGPAKPPPRGCAGRTRPQASWRAREGGGCPPESPRVPASPAASGSPGRGLLRAVEPRGLAFPHGLGSGRPGRARRARERELGGLRGTGAAARLSPPRLFPGLVCRRRGRPGGAREWLSLAGEGGWWLGRATSEASLPPGWRGLLPQVDWGALNMARCPPSCKLG